VRHGGRGGGGKGASVWRTGAVRWDFAGRDGGCLQREAAALGTCTRRPPRPRPSAPSPTPGGVLTQPMAMAGTIRPTVGTSTEGIHSGGTKG
jgi:hypothetical protein